MQGSQKSKRVSWASDANLCQVRLFLSEDSPSQVGFSAQDHLQAKKTLSGLQLNGLVADDNLPPGFEGFNPANQLKNKLAQIPLVKWRHPPKFILDVAWQVVNGEESKETEIQTQRELRVFEAIYPRHSAIPPNPAISPDVENAIHDDRTLTLIPITPIEEEDPSADPSSDSAVSVPTPNPSSLTHSTFPSSQNTSSNFDSERSAAGTAGSGQPDVLKAALTAVAKSNEQIDHDLLVKILSNPTILQQFIAHQGTSFGSQCVSPKPSGAPLFNQAETVSSSSGMISNGLLYPYPNGTGPMPLGVPQVPSIQSGSSPAMKDLNYYKNLIQQHGGDRQTDPLPPFTTPPSPAPVPAPATTPIHHPGMNQDSLDNSKPRDGKSKIMKPCIYFNSSKGCRHGANCVYQHDISFQQRASSIPEMQSAKRMKMDREIRGSQSYT